MDPDVWPVETLKSDIGREIHSAPSTGGPATLVTTEASQSPETIAAGAGHVCWLTWGATGAARCADANGDVTTISDTESYPQFISVHAASGTVYWTTAKAELPGYGNDATGYVSRAAFDGTNQLTAVFVTGEHAPLGVAVDSTKVYWTRVIVPYPTTQARAHVK